MPKIQSGYYRGAALEITNTLDIYVLAEQNYLEMASMSAALHYGNTHREFLVNTDKHKEWARGEACVILHPQVCHRGNDTFVRGEILKRLGHGNFLIFLIDAGIRVQQHACTIFEALKQDYFGPNRESRKIEDVPAFVNKFNITNKSGQIVQVVPEELDVKRCARETCIFHTTSQNEPLTGDMEAYTIGGSFKSSVRKLAQMKEDERQVEERVDVEEEWMRLQERELQNQQ